MSESYPELTLRIADDEVGLVVEHGYTFTLELDKLQELELLAARVFNTLASRETIEWWRQAVECLGSMLFNLLLSKGDIGKNFAHGVKQAGDSVCRVGFEFGDNANEKAHALTFLPWEFLYAPGHLTEGADVGVFLGVDSRFALYRKITKETRNPKSYVYRAVRLLIVLSDPSEQGEISLDTLLEALDRPEVRRVHDLAELAGPVRSSGLDFHVVDNPDRTRLQQVIAGGEWDIIHFIGHAGFIHRPEDDGGGGKVVLVENGKKSVCDAEEFATWLARPSDGFQQRKNKTTDLVILQTCEGAAGDHDMWSGFRGVAPRVAAEGFPAVVAMQYGVRNDIANVFAAQLYRALFNHMPLDLAVQSGRLRLATGDDRGEYASRDFASPVLFSSGKQIVFFPEVEEEEAAAAPESGPAVRLRGLRLSGTVRDAAPASEAAAPRRERAMAGNQRVERGRSDGEQPERSGGGRFGLEVDAKLGKDEG